MKKIEEVSGQLERIKTSSVYRQLKVCSGKEYADKFFSELLQDHEVKPLSSRSSEKNFFLLLRVDGKLVKAKFEIGGQLNLYRQQFIFKEFEDVSI